MSCIYVTEAVINKSTPAAGVLNQLRFRLNPLRVLDRLPPGSMADEHHFDVLDHVFSWLPDMDACVTPGRVCSTWRCAAQHHKAKRLFQRTRMPPELPVWYLEEIWPSLSTDKRSKLIDAALSSGQLDALRWLLGSGSWALDARTRCV